MHYTKIGFPTRALIQQWKRNGFSLGFVPTMGALHDGHLSLLKRSMAENDKTICSIFVNPRQFEDPVDFKKYPNTLCSDLDVLLDLGIDLLFHPEVHTIYPDDFKAKNYELNGLDLILEGRDRPGHFQGVCNVLGRLFQILPVHKAYFGQKDFQQTAVVKRLIDVLKLDLKIEVCPIVREENGLAMSSRNERLTKSQRKEAGFIYDELLKLKNELCQNDWILAMDRFKRKIIEAKNSSLEYIKIVDSTTLEEIDEFDSNRKLVALTAVKYHGVRLLDNIILNQ